MIVMVVAEIIVSLILFACIYGIGKLLGHNCLSLSVVVANRVRQEFSKDANASIQKLVKKTLETISNL